MESQAIQAENKKIAVIKNLELFESEGSIAMEYRRFLLCQ
jgi:hypothetical protein